MAFSRRAFNRMLALSAASAVLPGRALAQNASPKTPIPGGTLNWLYFPDPGSALVAINTSSGTGTAIGPKVNEGLLTYDYQLNPQPLLATAWEVTPDGLRYTFRLRPNVKWHDGRDFTSEDVAFTILRLREAHPRGRITYRNVVAVDTPDPPTAVVVLSQPAPYLIAAVSSSESPIVPKHIYEKIPPANGETLADVVGTGPFILKEWVPGSHLIFVKNPNYWDTGKPYLDRVILRIILDPAARAAALEAGEVDIGDSPVPRSDLDRLRANKNLRIDTNTYAYWGQQQHLFFNFDNEILRDKRVRQAIAHAIDLDAIVRVVYNGYAQASPSPISVALTKFYDPSIKSYGLDRKLAQSLLHEAGFKPGPDGHRIKLRLAYNAYFELKFPQFIKQSLAAIGIEVTILQLDLPTYLTTVYRDRAFDLTLEGLANTFDPSLGVQRAYWSKNFQIGLPFSNAAHYSDAEVDAVLEAAAIEPDEAKRRDLWYEFQHLIHDDVASVDLVAPSGVIVANKRVRNFAPGGQGMSNSFADVWLDPSA